MTNNKSPLKNKTYEKVFGVEKSRQIKQKMSEAQKKGIEEGRIKVWNAGLHTQTNTGRTHFKKGQKLSEETRQKLKGKIPPNKGKVREDIRQFIEANTNKHLCKCGCGNFIAIKKYHHRTGVPAFIFRHDNNIKLKYQFLKGHIPHNKGKSMVHNGSFKPGHSPPKEARKKMSETRKRLYQEGKITVWNKELPPDHQPNWQGGISNKPYTYDFSKKFKEAIKQRDNHCCKLCNIFEEDHLKLYGKKLCTHHADYIKVNTFPQNCITLCIRCNSIVNFNRQHWTAFFQSLLKEQYGYEYTQDQKMVLDFTDVKIDNNNAEVNSNETNKS